MKTLWLDLINTDWHNYRSIGQDEDRLDKPEWILHLLELWDLPTNVAVTKEALSALRQLRMLLQHMVDRLKERQPLEETDISALNGYLKYTMTYAQLVMHAEHFVLEEIVAKESWSWILGQIARSFAEMLVGFDVTRIKQCENPACRWLYYDASHNKTRRWCEETCANMMRVRRFRQRH